MKRIITAVFLLLFIITLPVNSMADEQRPTNLEQDLARQSGSTIAPEQPSFEQKKGEDKITGEIALSLLSAYISRGQELSRNSVVIQPSITLNYEGFSINCWGNLDTKPYSPTDIDYAAKYTETDITLSYTKELGIFQVTPGYIYYGLGAPNSDAQAPLDSQELFLTLQLNTLLTPTFTIYGSSDFLVQ